MSALPPEADMLIVGINVCKVPQADIRLVFQSVRRSCWNGISQMLVSWPLWAASHVRSVVSPVQRLHERKTKAGGGRSLCMPQIPYKA